MVKKGLDILILLIFLFIPFAFAILEPELKANSQSNISKLNLSIVSGTIRTMPSSTSKFGSSVWFDQSTAYVNTSGNLILDGSTNKTFEGWFYMNQSVDSDIRTIFDIISSDAFNVPLLYLYQRPVSAGSGLVLEYASGSLTNPILNTTILSINYTDLAWHHWAVVAYNSSITGLNKRYIRFFIDGISKANFSVVTPQVYASRKRLFIGMYAPGVTRLFKGGMDDIRISNTTRYLLHFNVPLVSFTKDGKTVALYHFGNYDPPLFYYNNTNATLPRNDTKIRFDIQWLDGVGLSKNYFETNITGTTKNYSTSLSGISANINITNITKVNGRFYWKSHTNDTSSNWTSTNRMFITVDAIKPSAYNYNVKFLSLTSGNNQRFYANITDNINPSCLYFQINDTNARTGIAENITMCGITNKANSSTVKSYNFESSNSNAFALIKLFYNDTYGNWNSTSNKKNFTVVESGGGGEVPGTQQGGAGGGGGGPAPVVLNLSKIGELKCVPSQISTIFLFTPFTEDVQTWRYQADCSVDLKNVTFIDNKRFNISIIRNSSILLKLPVRKDNFLFKLEKGRLKATDIGKRNIFMNVEVTIINLAYNVGGRIPILAVVASIIIIIAVIIFYRQKIGRILKKPKGGRSK